MKQMDLAAKAGVEQATLNRWEKGQREPTWSNVVKLCEALGIECTEFTKPKRKKKG